MPSVDDPRIHVDQLVAACRKGKPVGRLADFLLRACPPSPQGWVVSMLFGSSAQTVDVYDVQRYSEDPFAQSCLFWVRATGVKLEPGAGQSQLGLFAYGPGGYRYLSRRRSELERLLDIEGRPADDYDATALAQTLIDTLANQGPYSHALLTDPERLQAAEPLPGWGGGFRLDEAEWRRLSGQVTAPTCSGDEHHGWTLECWTAYGWMHDKRTLCRLRYRLRCAPGGYRERLSDFRIDEHIETLTERLFRAVPAARFLGLRKGVRQLACARAPRRKRRS